MTKQFHILTGGTSGMGLEIAKALARREDSHVIVGARRPHHADALRRAVPKDRLAVDPLDLDSLESVRGFADLVTEKAKGASLRSIICNAGLQLVGTKQTATPFIERTFMVNVLSHVLLVDLLQSELKPGARVVTVGSGTHNPEDPIARRFGFRGASFPSAARVVAGDLDGERTPQQQNMDRYATSKLGAIYHAMHLAREISPEVCSFYSFDPGLMPGTALARERSAPERFGWTYLMPVLRHVLPGVSSSAASAEALVEHCVDAPVHPSGSYIEFTGKPAPRSQLSENNENARDLIENCRAILSDGH